VKFDYIICVVNLNYYKYIKLKMRKNIIIFLFPQDKRRILKIHLKFPKSKHTYQPLWVLKVLNIVCRATVKHDCAINQCILFQTTPEKFIPLNDLYDLNDLNSLSVLKRFSTSAPSLKFSVNHLVQANYFKFYIFTTI